MEMLLGDHIRELQWEVQRLVWGSTAEEERDAAHRPGLSHKLWVSITRDETLQLAGVYWGTEPQRKGVGKYKS